MKRNIQLILVLLVVSFNSLVLAQNSSTEGKVEIIQDYRVKELLAKHIAVNERESVKGYRIKIHFGADKSVAYKIKEGFSEKYENVSAYVHYDQPYFNVTVGNYRTKLEAYKFLKEIQAEYTAAFLVQDNIELIDETVITEVDTDTTTQGK